MTVFKVKSKAWNCNNASVLQSQILWEQISGAHNISQDILMYFEGIWLYNHSSLAH